MSADEPAPVDPEATPTADQRLYIPDFRNWEPRIKPNWDKQYCYAKNPGEDYFHLLVCGELYFQKGDEKYCLNCARRLGVLTNNRMYWQRPGRPFG